MVNYCWITPEGHKITEYRPFSISYAVLHSPCLITRQDDGTMKSQYDADARGAGGMDNLVQELTGQQLKFDYLSTDVLRQLLEERVTIRDRNRSSILGQIGDVAGQISCASNPYSPDNFKQRQALEKTKLDLERELRETDERLWKDTAEVREKLITAARRFDGTYLRTSLFTPAKPYDDHNKGQGFSSLSDKV